MHRPGPIPNCAAGRLTGPQGIGPHAPHSSLLAPRSSPHGFTLVEILVVCAIIGIVMTIAIPMLHRQFFPESMNKVVADIMEACSHARAFAILNNAPVDLVISSEEAGTGLTARIFLQQGSASAPAEPGEPVDSPSVSGDNWRIKDRSAGAGAAPAQSGGEGINFSTVLPNKIGIELMEVNFQDAMEWAEARVRFYPNGTSDEFKMLLFRPDTDERRLISLETVTGIPDVETDVLKMRY